MNEQNASGTTYYEEYIAENFQLTFAEAILGIRYTDSPQKLPEPAAIQNVNLTIIDGELYLMNEGVPPDLKSLPEDAGILQV